MDRLAILAAGRRCPVLSKKLYTATTMGLPAGGGSISNSFSMMFLTARGFSGCVIMLFVAQPVNPNMINNINMIFILLEYKLS